MSFYDGHIHCYSSVLFGTTVGPLIKFGTRRMGSRVQIPLLHSDISSIDLISLDVCPFLEVDLLIIGQSKDRQ